MSDAPDRNITDQNYVIVLGWMHTAGRKIRELWFRIGTASKPEFALNLLNIASRAYQTYFAIAFSAGALAGRSFGFTQSLWLAVSLFYSAVYGLVPKGILAKKKWIEEDVRRSKSIGVAVSKISSGVERGNLTSAELHQIEQGILVAIRSEVEAQVLDTEGIYINATLLVPDPDNSGMLLVKNRANPDRELNVSYPKSSMLVWNAMKLRSTQYDPNFQGDANKPYKSIIAFPILYETQRKVVALGAVSVDSSRSHHFDRLEKKLDTKLLPYLALIKLVLKWRERSTREEEAHA